MDKHENRLVHKPKIIENLSLEKAIPVPVVYSQTLKNGDKTN